MLYVEPIFKSYLVKILLSLDSKASAKISSGSSDNTTTTNSNLTFELLGSFAIILAVPAFSAVTKPFSSTVAISGVAEDHLTCDVVPSFLTSTAFNWRVSSIKAYDSSSY